MLLSVAQPLLLLRLPSSTTRRLLSAAPPRSLVPIASGPPLRLRPRLRAAVSEQHPTEVVGMEAAAEGRPLRVGLICGGPSAERGVSLNSARSVLDHIQVRIIVDG